MLVLCIELLSEILPGEIVVKTVDPMIPSSDLSIPFPGAAPLINTDTLVATAL